jgi:hypothetical protein
MFFSCGYKPSLSTYWETPMQPLFIIINASTSYHMFAISNWRWRPSAVMLLTLTAFSVTDYGTTHNVLAVLFFVVSLLPLYLSKRYKYCFWLYLGTLPVMIYDMLLGEILAIFILCLFHGLILLKIKKLKDEGYIKIHR